MKYWKLDKIYYKFDIVNPDMTIRAQKLKYINSKTEEYKMYIK